MGWLQKLQAHGRRNLFVYARGFQFPIAWIYGEDDDIVRALIGDEQKSAGGIDREVARPVAFSRDVLDEREFAGARIDRENDDAVVAAIRTVEKMTRGRHVYVGTITRSTEVARQRRNCFDHRECSFPLVVCESAHRRIEFTDDV